MVTLLTALEIAGNYPDNILIESFEDDNGLYGGWMYMLRDGKGIHKSMMDLKGFFNTAEEAEECLHNICKECIEYVNQNFSEDEVTD